MQAFAWATIRFAASKMPPTAHSVYRDGQMRGYCKNVNKEASHGGSGSCLPNGNRHILPVSPAIF
jgi:hypothetical protein